MQQDLFAGADFGRAPAKPRAARVSKVSLQSAVPEKRAHFRVDLKPFYVAACGEEKRSFSITVSYARSGEPLYFAEWAIGRDDRRVPLRDMWWSSGRGGEGQWRNPEIIEVARAGLKALVDQDLGQS